MGYGFNEYDETHGWSAWMAFGENLATNCANENSEATGIDSNMDDSTDEILEEESGEATYDDDVTNEVLLYEEIIWEARVDHDVCVNEDDDEARVDHGVNYCFNEDDDANGCDTQVTDHKYGEAWEEWVSQYRTPSESSDGGGEEGENGSDHDVDESNNSYEGAYGGEDDVNGSDNGKESIDGNEEEYGSDSHSEYSINSNFVDSETGPATPRQIHILPTSAVSQEQLGQLSEDFCSICFGEFELDHAGDQTSAMHAHFSRRMIEYLARKWQKMSLLQIVLYNKCKPAWQFHDYIW